jgi:hypothetical protein
MTAYLSTYSSDLEDVDDCDDNFVKLPLPKNKTGKPPIARTHGSAFALLMNIICGSL